MGHEPEQRRPSIEEIEEWKQIYNVMIHFSDMILRARAIAFSVVLAAYGAAAYIRPGEPGTVLQFFGLSLSAAQSLVLFAILVIASVFTVDYFYYYRLLVSTVAICQSYEREKNIHSRLSQRLAESVSLSLSNFVIFIYYGIPLVIGVLLLFNL